MAEKATKVEGGVSRAVDFNLKKDDLMLLIMEGRKEQMEEVLMNYQNGISEKKREFDTANRKFNEKVKSIIPTLLNNSAIELVKSMTNTKELSTEEFLKAVSINRETSTIERVNYIKYQARSLDGTQNARSVYMKQQYDGEIEIRTYYKFSATVEVNIMGSDFVKRSKFVDKECKTALSRDYNSYNQSHRYTIELAKEVRLDREVIKTLPEFKAVKKVAEELAKLQETHSDLLAEYTVFNSNQPRAKAHMIKQVLATDENGKALLGNIFEAAKGVKLLSD